MTDDLPPSGGAEPLEDASAPASIEGDASDYLEELVVAPLAPLAGTFASDAVPRRIEAVGAHLRLRATVLLAGHRRLSDFLTHNQGLIECHYATVLRRNGEPTRVTARTIWVSPSEATFIADLDAASATPAPREMAQARARHPLVVVTPGHTLTGEVYLAPEAELSAFIASSYPPYIPITNVHTRSLADRRIRASYDFVLLNRSQIVAATGLQSGMTTGRAAI